MGSPSARLDVPEDLRPWLESGVEFVLRPEDAPAAADQPAERAAAQVRAQTPAPSSAPVRPPAPPERPAPGQPQAAPAQRRVPQPAPANPARPLPAQASSAAFPEPWATYLAKVAPEHKMVWTYMELGHDLGGQPDMQRRKMIVDLIQHLKLPPKPIAFWPAAVLERGALRPNPELFWRGWKQLRTPHIVCFGRDTLGVILPDADPSRTMHMFREFMVHVLPSMSELLAMLPHERQLAVDALSGLRL